MKIVRVHWWGVLLFMFCWLGLVSACQQKRSEHEFCIYLLADDIPAIKLSSADLSRVVLEEKPLIGWATHRHVVVAEIMSYKWVTHEIELREIAYQRVQQLFASPEVNGIPFAVFVDKQPIHLGEFWTPLSSQSYDGVMIMQPILQDRFIIKVEQRAGGLPGLGYPGTDFYTGKDPHYDPRIRETLEQAYR